MQWVCKRCRHQGPLDTFYHREWEVPDYECPTCHTQDNKHLGIPRIDLTDYATGKVEKFYVPAPKQVAMHVCIKRNLLWGGRAGTGKSWALRHDAYMRCMSIPGYRVLMLRRQFTELRDTHLDKAAMEVPKLTGRKESWRASEYTAVFNNGSRLRFGYCATDDDVRQYLSSEFDMIIFDEGATFTEYQVKFISSRLRTSKKGVVPILRIGSNPGAMFLYRYFIAKDIEHSEDESYDPEDYEFIPAEASDNPHVNQKEQNMRLNALPSEALRRMYRDGDWLAVEGQFFTDWRPTREEERNGKTIVREWHVITELPFVGGESVECIEWLKYVAVIDWGYDPDPGVLTMFVCLPSGRYIAFKEWTFKRTIPRIVAQTAAKMCKGLKRLQRIGGHDMWMTDKQNGESMAETFAKNGFSMRVADTDRINGWVRLHSLLQETVVELDPSGEFEVEYPLLQVYKQGCPQLAKTIPMLQADPKNIGDVLEKDDHWPDTARWFSMSRPVPSRKKKESEAWQRLPKEVRAAILGHGKRDVLGAESARRGA